MFKPEEYHFFGIYFCRGLRKLAMRNLGFGIKEMYRGFNIAAQVKLLQRYVPSLKVSDVTRYSILTYSIYCSSSVSKQCLNIKMAECAVSWILDICEI